MILGTVFLLAAASGVEWDQGSVAETIDSYWLGSSLEIAHRKTIAALVKQSVFPHERLLEIGCGSGLIYQQLVPDVLPNSAYVGVDISEAMLKIAAKRFPEGHFRKDDLFALSVPDGSFDVVAAFEVFGHIPDIQQPICEMFRTASRAVIFTVWTTQKTVVGREVIDQATFIHTAYSQEDVLKAIANALKEQPHRVVIQPLSHDKAAYILYKND